ncbi:MAG: threonine aldolase family protein [Actinobacteria bacterium]|nr:threonine aldolase family protein [Actinomycetota bacterium]
MEYIDFRSDTVTEPTMEMLDAMHAAKVGDDVYGDDPTVNLLEKKAAEAMGKESALFVPTGTFGNQLAILTHTERGNEVIIPQSNHIVIHEVGACAVIAGVQLRTLNDNCGVPCISDFKNAFRGDDIHFPKTGLVCMENAHSSGKVIGVNVLTEIIKKEKSHNTPVHLDGARIFNAAQALKTGAAEIAGYADSVMFCLSKGLCSPVGSMLAGTKKFISKARKNRKLMGGGLRQAGYLAAAGLISIEKMTVRLWEDHENARYLADRMETIKNFNVFKNRLDINMVFFTIENMDFNEDDFVSFLFAKKIKINPAEFGEYRFVTHYWIDKKSIDYTIDSICSFFKSK